MQENLKNFKVIQLDITDKTANQKALMKHLKVRGTPTFIFFDKKGNENEKRITKFFYQ